MYKNSLVLKEQIKKDEDGVVHRTDYIVTPKRGVSKLSGDRISIDSDLAQRFDNIINYFNQKERFIRGRGEQRSIREAIFGKEADIKRFLTSDGAEIYTYNGTEMLEVKADVCKECKDCNEESLLLKADENGKVSYNSWDGDTRKIREIREYKINPPLLGLLFGTGIHIAELTHPCQWINLQDILDPGYNAQYRIPDPPEIKIVFPK